MFLLSYTKQARLIYVLVLLCQFSFSVFADDCSQPQALENERKIHKTFTNGFDVVYSFKKSFSNIPTSGKDNRNSWIGKNLVSYSLIFAFSPVGEILDEPTTADAVTWYEAVLFCTDLTRICREQGSIKSNEVIRLPTKMELSESDHEHNVQAGENDAELFLEWTYDAYCSNGTYYASLVGHNAATDPVLEKDQRCTVGLGNNGFRLALAPCSSLNETSESIFKAIDSEFKNGRIRLRHLPSFRGKNIQNQLNTTTESTEDDVKVLITY